MYITIHLCYTVLTRALLCRAMLRAALYYPRSHMAYHFDASMLILFVISIIFSQAA